MANYSIESNPRYQALIDEFKQANGRMPNELDKLGLMDHLRFIQGELILQKLEEIQRELEHWTPPWTSLSA